MALNKDMNLVAKIIILPRIVGTLVRFQSQGQSDKDKFIIFLKYLVDHIKYVVSVSLN